GWGNHTRPSRCRGCGSFPLSNPPGPDLPFPRSVPTSGLRVDRRPSEVIETILYKRGSVMGVESFLVKIRGPREEYPAVVRFAESEFPLTPEPPGYVSGDYSYYSFRDGHHVIEWE